MPVVQRLPVLHLEDGGEAGPEPAIEVDQMRVDVVQEGPPGPEAEGHGQPAAERLREAPAGMAGPQRAEVRNLPALAARPLQRRPRRRYRWGSRRRLRAAQEGALPGGA